MINSPTCGTQKLNMRSHGWVASTMNWISFQKHVRDLTGISPPEAMQLCSYLKKQKELSLWTETEIKDMKATWEATVKPEKQKKEKTDIESPKPKPKKEKAEKAEKPKKEKSEKSKNATVEEVKGDEDPVMLTPGPNSSEKPEKPEESIASLEFHLAEAKKKVALANSVVEKEEAVAKKATEKLEEATKIVADLSLKAEKAVANVADARTLVEACQKEVATRSEELEKALVLAATVPTSEPADLPSDPIHIRRKKIPKHIKTLVWNKYNGPNNASADCVSCRTMKISNRSFHCGHVIAESKGGDMTINNLRPICDACNGSMGTRSMNEFTKEFFGWTV